MPPEAFAPLQPGITEFLASAFRKVLRADGYVHMPAADELDVVARNVILTPNEATAVKLALEGKA